MFLVNRFERVVEQMRGGAQIPLRIELWNGRRFDLSPEPKVTVTIPHLSALRYFVSPDLNKLGEAFVEGHIRVQGSIHDVFRVGECLARGASASAQRGIRHFARHTRSRDRRSIEYHYDVSNDFYALFLDRNMVYSCAYYRTDTDSLDQAQENKLDHILKKLMVKPGDRFLDVGCGWGALIIRAAQKYGALATGITLSRNQHALATQKIKEVGLEGRCVVELRDYRDVEGIGRFDKISSVGMFEHVGLKNLPGYFSKLRSLLADDGLMLNHGITASDPDNRWVGLGAGEFIDRYVFPQGELPHLATVMREMSLAGLEVTDVESLRRHYARTCGEWADRLDARKERAVEFAGERRTRIWEVYLAGCAYGFAQGWMNIYQILARKEGSKSSALPMTREYMYSS